MTPCARAMPQSRIWTTSTTCLPAIAHVVATCGCVSVLQLSRAWSLVRRSKRVAVPPELAEVQELIDRMLQLDADARLDIDEVSMSAVCGNVASLCS